MSEKERIAHAIQEARRHAEIAGNLADYTIRTLETERDDARAAAARYWLLLIDNGIQPPDGPRWLKVTPAPGTGDG